MGFGLSPWRICSRMRSARRRAMRLTPRGAFGTTILMARENIANALGPVDEHGALRDQIGLAWFVGEA